MASWVYHMTLYVSGSQFVWTFAHWGFPLHGKIFTLCLVCQAVNSQEGKLMFFFLGQKLHLKILQNIKKELQNIKHNLCYNTTISK